MFLVGERKLLRALQTAINTNTPGIISFKRGSITGKIVLEPYKEVIGITMSIFCRTLPEIVEENYVDVDKCCSKYNTIEEIQKALPQLFRICQLGLYVRYGVWENPLPKETTLEEIQYYFNISDKALQEARRTYYKHGKDKISVIGTYYGEKRITLLQSNKTEYITNIIGIE